MHTDTNTTGKGPSQSLLNFVARLDWISDITGKGVSFLVLPMMYVLLHEVVARYCFNAPTIWAGDMALILFGIYFMIASPYCLKEGMHIRTDFLYSHWSTRTKGMVDAIIYIFLYFPAHIVFLEVGWKYFYKSFMQNEAIISSPWMPIIWPMKMAIPVSIVLMLSQGLSETIKSICKWRYNQTFWEDHEHGDADTCGLAPTE